MRADAAENRARLLLAARACFAEEGVGVPLDAVAARAGVGPGTLHRHFPTKEALIAAVLEGDLAAQVARARALGAGGDPAALFEALDGLLEIGLANRALKAALAASDLDLSGGASEASAALRETLAELLARAQAAGVAVPGLGVEDVLALLAGALAAQDHAAPADRARVRALALAGLRPPAA
jgi:AcrR family transcriptional regulator